MGGGPGGGGLLNAGSPGESSPAGKAPETPSSTPDKRGRAFGGSATDGGAPQWRSEARAFASRSRTLSNELGHIDRTGSREASRSRSENARGEQKEGTTASGTSPSTTSNPGTPDDPDQVPLGGAEWLAAAGAAYALNRLRREDGEESELEDDA